MEIFRVCVGLVAHVRDSAWAYLMGKIGISFLEVPCIILKLAFEMPFSPTINVLTVKNSPLFLLRQSNTTTRVLVLLNDG